MEPKTIILIIMGVLFMIMLIVLPILSIIAYINTKSPSNPTVITDPIAARDYNGVFIKGANNIVYYVTNGELHQFSTSTLADKWGIANVMRTDTNITNKIAIGATITTDPVLIPMYNDKVVVCLNNSAMFYIQNGTKRWIPTNEIAVRLLNGGETQVIDCALLWNAPSGPTMT